MALILTDMVMIHGVNTGVQIGDDGFKPIWETTFSTKGLLKTGNAILCFQVKHLTLATQPPLVRINNQPAGSIYPYHGANSEWWFSQSINLTGGILQDGDNELEVQAALAPPGGQASGAYDDYVLRNIYCLFQKRVTKI